MKTPQRLYRIEDRTDGLNQTFTSKRRAKLILGRWKSQAKARGDNPNLVTIVEYVLDR